MVVHLVIKIPRKLMRKMAFLATEMVIHSSIQRILCSPNG
jgi:hypothetical protein